MIIRLSEDSTEESKRAGALATKMGVEHHILTVDWGNINFQQYNYYTEARRQRYKVMLDFCTQHSIPTLMTAHHQDDQIGTSAESALTS